MFPQQKFAVCTKDWCLEKREDVNKKAKVLKSFTSSLLLLAYVVIFVGIYSKDIMEKSLCFGWVVLYFMLIVNLVKTMIMSFNTTTKISIDIIYSLKAKFWRPSRCILRGPLHDSYIQHETYIQTMSL